MAVLAGDGTVVGGGAGTRGAIYIPKGGNYHLQIDYDPLPQISGDANPSPPPSPNPYSDPAFRNRMMFAALKGPYAVEVISAATQPDDSSLLGNPLTMPFFKVPAGAMTSTPAPAAASGAPTAASFSGAPSGWNNAPGSPATPGATPPPAPATAPAAAASLTQDQARAVVLIKGDMGEGTGFLVKTKDGPVVITNQHVLANNPNITITTSNGVSIPPLSYKGATDRDLAMIAIKDTGFSYLTLATDVTAVAPGDPTVTPGNSEGGEVMLNTNGKVVAVGPDRIEIDNPIYHGNSGGPVYDSKTNQVIGVVTEAIKVDTSDELDKASFASRDSAIHNGMRYFAMRLDNVPQWEDIDWRAFQSETAFLDKFNLHSRCIDCFLNTPSSSDNNNGQQQQQSSDPNSQDANLWKQDTALVRANEQFEDQSGGNVDTSQQMDAVRELFGGIVDAANTDYTTIQNQNNFYMYDRQRAKDEMEYRKAIKDELDRISNNISRLGALPRRN